MENKTRLCPSAPCKEDAILIGIVSKEGKVSFANRKIIVDEKFVQIARKGRSPQKRFRFSAPCIMDGCEQWGSGRCQVIDEMVRIFGTKDEEVPCELPECPIRDECRWYDQCGPAACSACPKLITDVS